LPGTVLIGRDGRVAKIISGVVDQAGLRKEIQALLAVAKTSDVPKESAVTERRKEVSAVPS
jgi:hypothetical protein